MPTIWSPRSAVAAEPAANFDMSDLPASQDLSPPPDEGWQQPTAGQREQTWLAVVCRGAGLLLPLSEAGEISAYAGSIHVPHTRSWFLGVTNLRGQLQGVVDLGGFLGLGASDIDAGNGWVVALNSRLEANCALRVDQLAGLRREAELVAVDGQDDTFRAASLPPFAGRRLREGAEAGRVWQEIRLNELAANAHFLDILAPQ